MISYLNSAWSTTAWIKRGNRLISSGERAGLRRRRAWVQIAAATLSRNNLKQTVDIHRASVHQAAKLVTALLRVARVTAGLAKVLAAYYRVYDSRHLQADPKNRDQIRNLCSAVEYGLPLTLPFRQNLYSQPSSMSWVIGRKTSAT